jgi:hypothetical protein
MKIPRKKVYELALKSKGQCSDNAKLTFSNEKKINVSWFDASI